MHSVIVEYAHDTRYA